MKIMFNSKQIESLERLYALMQNKDFALWFHRQFYTLGFIPVEYELPEDIKNWRKVLKEILS